MPGFTSEPMDRRARVVLGWFGILVGLAGLAGIVLDRRAANRRNELLAGQAARFRAQTETDSSAVSWEGQTFRPGDRVRIAKWAGTFKPEETGARVQVHAGRGPTGIVVRGERRVSTDYLRIDPKEPIQIVRVRWLPQQWNVVGRDERIDLPEFEATIHVSHLEVIR